MEQYLVFAEGQAMRRVPMSMADWIKKLDGFLTLNDRNILSHAGKVSHDLAKEVSEREFDIFHQKQIKFAEENDNNFERTIAQIESTRKK